MSDWKGMDDLWDLVVDGVVLYLVMVVAAAPAAVFVAVAAAGGWLSAFVSIA